VGLIVCGNFLEPFFALVDDGAVAEAQLIDAQ
jgi:hypothetical protein